MKAKQFHIRAIVTSLLLVLAWLVVSTPITNAAPPPVNLPAFPVQATYVWDGTANQFTSVTFTGIGIGYDVKDNTPYVGWCVERTSGPAPAGTTVAVRMYSSYDPALPANLTKWGTRTIPWDQINYALNHRQGVATTDVAKTIWDLIEGTFSSIPLEVDAIANGTGFVPGPGQVVAVILTNGNGINTANDNWQENIIELKLGTPTAVTLSSFNVSAPNDALATTNAMVPFALIGVGLISAMVIWKRVARRA